VGHWSKGYALLYVVRHGDAAKMSSYLGRLDNYGDMNSAGKRSVDTLAHLAVLVEKHSVVLR
jgi:hypothetical protein